LPTWIAWYVHQLPLWLLRISTVVMFAIELVVPFLVFGPRRLRFVACVALFGLQVIIFLTGNYCFFNLLTMVLCLFLLDDSVLKKAHAIQVEKMDLDNACIVAAFGSVAMAASSHRATGSNDPGDFSESITFHVSGPNSLATTDACLIQMGEFLSHF